MIRASFDVEGRNFVLQNQATHLSFGTEEQNNEQPMSLNTQLEFVSTPAELEGRDVTSGNQVTSGLVKPRLIEIGVDNDRVKSNQDKKESKTPGRVKEVLKSKHRIESIQSIERKSEFNENMAIQSDMASTVKGFTGSVIGV